MSSSAHDHDHDHGTLPPPELDGAPPGADIDLMAAIGDMVTYHGGPLRCLA